MKMIKKIIKKIFGVIIFAIGLIGLALPIIPGTILVLLGLAII